MEIAKLEGQMIILEKIDNSLFIFSANTNEFNIKKVGILNVRGQLNFEKSKESDQKLLAILKKIEEESPEVDAIIVEENFLKELKEKDLLQQDDFEYRKKEKNINDIFKKHYSKSYDIDTRKNYMVKFKKRKLKNILKVKDLIKEIVFEDFDKFLDRKSSRSIKSDSPETVDLRSHKMKFISGKEYEFFEELEEEELSIVYGDEKIEFKNINNKDIEDKEIIEFLNKVKKDIMNKERIKLLFKKSQENFNKAMENYFNKNANNFGMVIYKELEKKYDSYEIEKYFKTRLWYSFETFKRLNDDTRIVKLMDINFIIQFDEIKVLPPEHQKIGIKKLKKIYIN